MTMASGEGGSWPNLYEFLLEAELGHYYSALKNDLKVASISQLKYVEEDDLLGMGMTRPEQRRLRKFFNKYYPQNYILKIKKMILPKSREEPDRTSILLSDTSTLERSSIRVPSKHIISADTIVINKELGVGEFGVVQQGVWTNEDGERIQVAIKCLSKARMQNNYMEFLKEAAIMHSIDHQHIVRLYGVVLDTSTLMMVTELAPLRSLLECLKEPGLRSSFPIISLCDFALQICEGMAYLESKRLIHRDLAARNVLVYAKNNVKISDFGLSRALGVGKDYYQTNFNVNLKLPIAWCAPECINFLRFTSASDVWAYGVTLWEMFSYGFQPWAALTGQQILEAIDDPNLQRLEQPECCPKEYYSLMLRCWQHDITKRPKFADIINLLPDCKVEQVQAVKDSSETCEGKKPKKELMQYTAGDVITVLDKRPGTDCGHMWKGVLANGKSGLFNPSNTVAYLGHYLPTNRGPSFHRGDSKINIYASSRKSSRLRPDMISGPQGDLKHTGHVGLDGAFFGDIAFLGDKYNQLPKQVVTPYKPHEDREQSFLTRASSDLSDKAPLLIKSHSLSQGKNGPASETWSIGPEEYSMTDGKKANGTSDKHEYHEISDNELDDDDFASIESPRFESLDFGPSLMDEFLKALDSKQSDFELEAEQSNENNVKNEIKEITSKVMGSKDQVNKKKAGTVKNISAQDQETLESAIAMAKELASKSMLGLDKESSMTNESPPPPVTPTSPSRHHKFSFKFKSSPKQERRKFSQEAEAIPDIQSMLTQDAKEAYNSLVEKGQGLSQDPKTQLAAPPFRSSVRSSISSEMDNDSNPLRMLRTGVPVRPKVRGNKHIPVTPHSATMARLAANANALNSSTTVAETNSSSSCASSGRASLGAPPPPPLVKSGPLEFVHTGGGSGSSSQESSSNPLPLPPRDRSRPLPVLKQHQRKYPLLLSEHSANQKESACVDIEEGSHTYSNVSVKRSALLLGSAPMAVPESSSPESPLSSPTSLSPPTSEQHKPNHRKSVLDESFETCIQAEIDSLDSIPVDPIDPVDPVTMYKSTDHVSCEDLLEFALDRPQSINTRGRARGAYSDEVRIMQKVLAKEDVSADGCLSALEETDWDVHKAIKLKRLHSVLRGHGLSTDDSRITLARCNWDVDQAANYLLATRATSQDTTEV